MWLLATLIASAVWATVNILDSMLIHRYESKPFVLLWFDSLFRLPLALILIIVTNVSFQSHGWFLLLAGMIFCLAAYVYMYLLRYLDISVTQCAWAIEAIFLSITGFWIFKETWSVMQTIGSVFILGGVFLVSFWHAHVSFRRTVLLLTFLAGMTAPSNIIIKYVVSNGTSVISAITWSQLGLSLTALFLPLVSGQARASICTRLREAKGSFYGFIWLITLLVFTGSFLTSYAFAHGSLSLVAIAGNAQIFLVVLFTWLLIRLRVPHIPKELLTRQSVIVKIIGFLLVTAGVGLLGNY